MLKIILQKLKRQAEKIIAEEQAGFRAERCTTADLQLRILCEKYLQHQQDFYHVLDFKKAFDRVLPAAFVGNHEEVHQRQSYPSHQKLSSSTAALETGSKQ